MFNLVVEYLVKMTKCVDGPWGGTISILEAIPLSLNRFPSLLDQDCGSY